MKTLYDPIEPYQQGMLKVSAIHDLYYEQCGNPDGQPVVFLHGGPGAGLTVDYRRFFEMVYPRLDKGGLFIAHNVVNKRDEMKDFLDVIQTNPSLWTTIVSPSGEGMSVSRKR